MEHFICYFNIDITIERIQYILNTLFNVSKQEIGELLDENKNIKVRYEFEYLNNFEKKGFYIELNIYISSDLSVSLGLYNNLLLAYEIASLLNIDVLINDESNDPYQWILVKNTRRIYLVEEKELDNNCITFNDFNFELLFSRSLKLLPGLKDVGKKLPVYFVENPNLWKKAIKRPDS